MSVAISLVKLVKVSMHWVSFSGVFSVSVENNANLLYIFSANRMHEFKSVASKTFIVL